jgi:hypothetical protein
LRDRFYDETRITFIPKPVIKGAKRSGELARFLRNREQIIVTTQKKRSQYRA